MSYEEKFLKYQDITRCLLSTLLKSAQPGTIGLILNLSRFIPLLLCCILSIEQNEQGLMLQRSKINRTEHESILINGFHTKTY